MVKHKCEDYGTFEDWFLGEMDAALAQTLRDYGAGCGVAGLINWSDISALFGRFGSEIEDYATDVWGCELWEVAQQRKVCRVGELVTLLVHAAAEHLAVIHEQTFQESAEAEEGEGQ